MGLAQLPPELIWYVLLLARSESLALVSRTLRAAVQSAPRAVRTEYLLCRWLDSYALRFAAHRRADARVPALACAFLPTTFPATGAAPALRRAATCDVLSYMARFRLFTPDVLMAAEARVVRAQLCGNICQLHGIFATGPTGVQPHTPVHLACHSVPEWLFRHMSTVDPGDAIAALPEPLRDPLHSILRHLADMVPRELQETPPPLPPLPALEVILRLVLVHRASVNSSQGYPLAAAIHMRSAPLICFLLAAGADPALKKGIALQLAAKKGWVAGMRLLVERDDKLEFQWRARVQVIAQELRTLSILREALCRRASLPARRVRPALAESPSKRRRLGDRCKIDARLLNMAVRSKAWPLVHYMMDQKGLVPDVETLQLMDQLGVP
ncbi:hypothetical protein MSPP1_002682 [Malassezia sp. CBS 17886]|nr:hypothetical protein MSPP1_002682 [Malassezia sp. CBS 17886]